MALKSPSATMLARASYLALLGLALLVTGCDSAEPETASVTYRVSSFGQFPASSAATLAYDDGDGQRQTLTNVSLPWEKAVEIESGGQAYLSATSQSTAGALGMRIQILADGQVVETDEGDGAAGLPGTQQLTLSTTTTVE